MCAVEVRPDAAVRERAGGRMGPGLLLAMSALVLAHALMGCRDLDRTTRCDDLVCPLDTACAELLERCVPTGQLEACEGKAEQEACSFAGVDNGRCLQSVCLSAGCGNEVVEPGEMCDDGNQRDGDGCSADCLSDETCGNDIIDVAVGERCDDGGRVDGDGCQANCALPRCGDGIQDPEEACDDGNGEALDGCNPQCTSDETCGNGIIDVAVGETCDDGNSSVGDGCGPSCRIETCGNGTIDPGERCDDGNTLPADGCSADCQSDETCGNGVIDVSVGEGCDDGDTEPGDGCSATCLLETCGNGIVEPQEVCDDGNTISGDGCSGTCLSDETCGNEVIDPVTNEQCDDGNFASHDGCSSGCSLEVPSWVEIVDEPFPPTVFGRMAYDAGRERVIMQVGGVTFTYDDRQWQQLDPPTPARAIVNRPIAYDAVQDRVFAYGGFGFDDMWSFDGTTWSQIFPAEVPPPRVEPALVYDAARDELVLFGGDGRNDTWVFEDGMWSERASGAVDKPPARERPRMAYHAGRRTVILHGGEVSLDKLHDTWEWDGSEWAQIDGTPPSAEGDLVYDAAHDRLVLFGGDRPEVMSFWDGSWVDVPTGGAPPSRASLVYDPVHEVTIAVGGTRRGENVAETWELADDTWSRVLPSPGVRVGAGASYDERRGRVVLYGGRQDEGLFEPYRDTWEYQAGSWRKVELDNDPGAHTGWSQMVYDRARGRSVLVQAESPEDSSRTWAYAGGAFEEILTTSQPPPLLSIYESRIAYDLSRDRVVLASNSQGWEFDGAQWQLLVVSSTLSQRIGALAYDPGRALTVLVGRAGLVTYQGPPETPGWQRIGASSPGPGIFADTMVFHDRRRSLIVRNRDTTWELLDDDSFRQVTTPLSPPPREYAAMTYDPTRGAVVLVGGSPQDDTWELSWTSLHPDERCDDAGDEDGDGLEDCADPDCTFALCGDMGLRCNEAGACSCPGGATEVSCFDRYDDDCDGLTDCADPDCAAAAYCTVESDCHDGSDNDRDHLVDCAEPQCAGTGYCETYEQSCADGEDNDGDGRVDCQDPNCFPRACDTVLP